MLQFLNIRKQRINSNKNRKKEKAKRFCFYFCGHGGGGQRSIINEVTSAFLEFGVEEKEQRKRSVKPPPKTDQEHWLVFS